MSKIVCIYHSIDLDGQMSAAIVKLMYERIIKERSELRKEDMSLVHTMDFIGYNYGQPIPDLSSYGYVIMCDISFPEEEMFKIYMQKEYGNFIWLDHHISAINISLERDYEDTPGDRDTNFAACELTWKYFFPKETMPEIVRLLGRYDCFGHKGTEEEQMVLEFQYGARQCITDYIDAYEHLLDCNIETILNRGHAIYQYLCTEAKQTYKNGFVINFTGDYPINGVGLFYNGLVTYKFICINKERFNPINFGIDYHKDGYDGCACFHIDSTGTYCFSLYNDNGLVDCSLIAKQFGGGGHKGASGFRVKDVLKVINNA